MDPNTIASSILAQFATAWSAPVPVLTATTAAGLLIWWFVNREYAAQLARLRQDVASEQAEVTRLRNKMADTLPSPPRQPDAMTKRASPPAPVAPSLVTDAAAADARETRRAIASLQRAEDEARLAVVHNTEREAERAMPGMKAALITAQKRFGIPHVALDDEGQSPIYALEFRRRLLERILPMLEAGHYDEACAEAKAYMGKFGL